MLKEAFHLKIIFFLAALVLFLSPMQPGMAQNTAESTSTENATSSDQVMQETRKNTTTTATKTSDTTKSATKELGKKTRELVRARIWRIVKRFQTAMNRLANIADRISSRNKKMEKAGSLTDQKSIEVTEKTTSAREKISSAGDNIILAAAELKQALSGKSSPLKAYNNFEKYTQASKNDLKTARKNLKKAVEIMKSAR